MFVSFSGALGIVQGAAVAVFLFPKRSRGSVRMIVIQIQPGVVAGVQSGRGGTAVVGARGAKRTDLET